jgi:hypothetical protein
MTRTATITKNPLMLLLAGLAAAVSIAVTAGQADAATPATVAATCYSDGYITVSDGGNIASAPQYLRLKIARRTAQGWRWQSYSWRPVNGGSFRLNATRGGQFYIYATIATSTGSGFSYSSDYVSVTNVQVSPIGAVTATSRTKGFCQT